MRSLSEYHIQVLRPLFRRDVLPQGLGMSPQDGQGRFQLMGRRPGEGPFPLESLALAVVGNRGLWQWRPTGVYRAVDFSSSMIRCVGI